MSRARIKLKAKRRVRRKRHVRKKIYGHADRPRLTVFRSLTHIYAQVIDDDQGRTLASSSTMEKAVAEGLKGTGNCDSAKAVGLKLAEKVKAAGVGKVVFDRNGYKYHGRVKALADGAREGGLEL